MIRELTPMQGANWVGRNSATYLEGVAAHLYAEFDGHDIDSDRLQRAVHAVCRLHPMLQLRVDADGRQHLDTAPHLLSLDIEDLRTITTEALTERLAAKRRAWSGRKLDIENGEAAAFGLSLLPGGACRLHVDTDMIAIDPNGFRIVMEDLARLYGQPERANQPAAGNFFQWLDLASHNSELIEWREHDKAWWRQRLADMPPAPALPMMQNSAEPESDRLAVLLSPDERRALETCARSHRVTVSVLALGLLAAVLGRATGTARFRLSVPVFWRAPLIADIDHVVGDFSNVLIVGIDLEDADTLAAFCRKIGEQMVDLLAHASYSGVNVMRDLSRHHGTVQTAPVVFTAGLGLAGRSLFSAAVARAFGRMNWVISQGPQVAIDAQVVDFEDGILVNWDVRLDALPEAWVRATFDSYVALLRRIAAKPDELDVTWDKGNNHHVQADDRLTDKMPVRPPCEFAGQSDTLQIPLTDLQQAYLLGRERHLPLGGVAMQEFREYRGRIDVDALPDRLIALVKQHAGLRTLIDGNGRFQKVLTEANINYDEIDLRDDSHEDALRQIDGQREDYAHARFDLARSPWNVTAFRLPPSGEADSGSCVLFVRFDALILDGNSIASLLVHLIDGGSSQVAEGTDNGTSSLAEDPTKPQRDADYWHDKLKSVEGPPQLPWKKPLPTIAVSRYDRESLSIDRQHFASLCRLGAAERLFKNTAVSALLLEVLTPWLSEGALCVGVPVAPAASPQLANHSSFIAVHWDGRRGSFRERTRALQSDVLEGLEHLAWSGVHISRLLMNANPGQLALPVVITNGLSWPVPGKGSDVRLHGGLTQTPQVVMDIRFSKSVEGHLVIDIDHAREAIDCRAVRDILAGVEGAVAAILARGAFDVTGHEFVDLGHYSANSSEHDFACSGFLRRIADHLFVRDTAKAALICGQRQISYAELGASVGRVMRSLRARGIGQGSIVAICLARSPEHTAVTLACALNGIIWVPIDATSPPERLGHLFANCRPDLVVAAEAVSGYQRATPEELLAGELLSDIRGQLPDLDALSSSREPAYYLYTSGTTGRPKCVVLSNRATSNVVGRTSAEWQIDDSDVFISVTPLHHDMSVFDVFGCLAAGAALVLPSAEEAKDAIAWNRLVAEHGVTIWCSVPAILEMLLSCRPGDRLASLRLIAQGGDYIKPSVIAELRQRYPSVRLISLGGPTETTIWSIWHEIAPGDVDVIPYGRPLPGNSYFILNDRGQHCPLGTVGRIHTAGLNVALGYLQDGLLDQTDFVTVTNEKGLRVRAFRTGDRGQYRRDGTILFAGRVDGYVKIRGVRASLPDIETELARHPGIKAILVVDCGAELRGETEIGVVYVPIEAGKPNAAALRAHARTALPDSHVPTRFLDVNQLPLSANGKPDRRKARELILAATERREQTKAATAVPPAIARASKILDLYLAVLDKTAGPGIDHATDFIRIGLLPSHLKPIANRIRDTFDVALTPRQLVRCRNAEQVELLLRNGGR